MTWALNTLGIQPEFLSKQPIDLSADQMVSAYPQTFHPDGLKLWLSIPATTGASTDSAWKARVAEFFLLCDKHKVPRLVMDSTRNGHNGRVRAFLSQQRWRILNYIELELGDLFSYNIRQTKSTYTIEDDTLVVASELEIRLPMGLSPFDVLSEFRKRQWVSWPANNPMKRKGVFSAKYRKLLPGVLTVGMSASIGQTLYLWYTIRCPYVPIPETTDGFKADGLSNQVNKLWKIITNNHRWWITNNPRARYF